MIRPLAKSHAARRIGLAALVAALAAASAAQAQAPLPNVEYGTLNYTAAEWPLMIAIKEGFFTKEGVDLSVATLGAPQNVISALASDAVNIGDDGTDSCIAAVAHHLPIKIVAGGFAVDPYSLIVPDSITSLDQLKGKTIMLGTKEDVTAITFGAMLKPANLTVDDFSIAIAGSTPARYQALLSGNAQGSILLQPFDLLAESQGYHALATGQQVLSNWLFATIAVNESWAAQNRPAVLAVLRALRDGVRYGATHKADAVAILISYTHADPAIASKSYDLDFAQWKAFRTDFAVTPSQIDAIARQQIAFGVITEEPPFADIYDGSFVQALGR